MNMNTTEVSNNKRKPKNYKQEHQYKLEQQQIRDNRIKGIGVLNKGKSNLKRKFNCTI